MSKLILCAFIMFIPFIQANVYFDNEHTTNNKYNGSPYRYQHHRPTVVHKKHKVRRLSESGPIIPNQCGSLGDNEPLQARDCQVFTLSKGYCCYLTITKNEGEETIQRSACIVSPNNNPKKKAELINSYSYLEGDVLIECEGNYKRVLYSYYWLISLIIFIFY